MGVNSFRWHTSSFLPAVAIYNDRAIEGVVRASGRKIKRISKKRRQQQQQQQHQQAIDRVHSADESKSCRVQSAKQALSNKSLSEVAGNRGGDCLPDPATQVLDAYGHQANQASRKSLGSAYNRQSRQVLGEEFGHDDDDCRQRGKIWDRLSIPRHVRSRSTSSVPGTMQDELQSQKQKHMVPPRLNYLYGFFLKRPVIKTFEPFLKRNHRYQANDDPRLLTYLDSRASDSGIQIQVPTATKANICLDT